MLVLSGFTNNSAKHWMLSGQKQHLYSGSLLSLLDIQTAQTFKIGSPPAVTVAVLSVTQNVPSQSFVLMSEQLSTTMHAKSSN